MTLAQRKAKALLQDRVITKREMDDLLRADALFRFEEEQLHASAPPSPPSSPLGCRLGPEEAAAMADFGAGALAEAAAFGQEADSSWGSVDSTSAGHGTAQRAIRNAQRAAMKRRRNELRRNLTRQHERDSQMAHDTRAWERVLAQKWDDARQSKLVCQLCLRGIPPAVRGRAWTAMIGNQLLITPELFEITAKRARETSKRQQAMKEARRNEAVARLAEAQTDVTDGDAAGLRRSGRDSGGGDSAGVASLEHRPALGDFFVGKEQSMQLLDQDLPRTFPEYAFFHTTGILREVLQTYVCYRPDLGYVQGMSYLASMLLLYLDDEFECFKAFANLLNQHFFFHFYQLERSTVEVHLKVFEHFFEATLPLLYNHFRRNFVKPDMYYLEWCLTLFVKFLPLDVATRLWDSYLLQGEAFCIRAALGILKMHAAELGEMEMEGILQFVQHLPADMDQTLLFGEIESIQITPDKCERVVQRISDPGAGQIAACRPS